MSLKEKVIMKIIRKKNSFLEHLLYFLEE